MLVHIPNDGDEAMMICEECWKVILIPDKLRIVNVWQDHARVCPNGCKPPSPKATHLKLTPLPRG